MTKYDTVLCDLAKQGLVFTIGKTGCHVMPPEQAERRQEKEAHHVK